GRLRVARRGGTGGRTRPQGQTRAAGAHRRNHLAAMVARSDAGGADHPQAPADAAPRRWPRSPRGSPCGTPASSTPPGRPTGTFLGAPKPSRAPQPGALVVAEAIRRAGGDADTIDECIMGNVVSAGLGQNPARQAALNGGLPDHVAAVTINKVCGSGLKAV